MFDLSTQDLHEKSGASQQALHPQGSWDICIQFGIFTSLVHQSPAGETQIQFRAPHVHLSMLWEPEEPTQWHCDPASWMTTIALGGDGL